MIQKYLENKKVLKHLNYTVYNIMFRSSTIYCWSKTFYVNRKKD